MYLVMVGAGVFIPQGVKINQHVYRVTVLELALSPWAKSHIANDLWIFQQDSAPAYKAKATQEWLSTHFPNSITAD